MPSLLPYAPGFSSTIPLAELTARERIIRDNFAGRGLTLTNLELVGVKTTRLRSNDCVSDRIQWAYTRNTRGIHEEYTRNTQARIEVLRYNDGLEGCQSSSVFGRSAMERSRAVFIRSPNFALVSA